MPFSTLSRSPCCKPKTLFTISAIPAPMLPSPKTSQLGGFLRNVTRILNQQQGILVLGITYLSFSLAIGCVRPHTEKDFAKATGHETEHEHFPPHWPTSLFQASARLEAMVADPDIASSNPNVSSSNEFADLFLWLPFLAADSDLGREEFSRIDSWSTQFADRLEQDAQSKKALRDIVANRDIQSVIHELSQICVRESQRLQAMQQEYDSPQ